MASPAGFVMFQSNLPSFAETAAASSKPVNLLITLNAASALSAAAFIALRSPLVRFTWLRVSFSEAASIPLVALSAARASRTSSWRTSAPVFSAASPVSLSGASSFAPPASDAPGAFTPPTDLLSETPMSSPGCWIVGRVGLTPSIALKLPCPLIVFSPCFRCPVYTSPGQRLHPTSRCNRFPVRSPLLPGRRGGRG